MEINNSYSFLVVGKTQESTETQEFKRYIGLASSFVIAVNPNKKELEAIYNREMANDPEYVVDTDNGKEARITFIVKTDPESNNGVEIINRVMFTLRNAPAYNRDRTKMQVIDMYGNSAWGTIEDVKAGKQLFDKDGNPLKIDTKYRICFVGEAELTKFLTTYLGVKDAFKKPNGVWVKQENADSCLFELQNIKDCFSGKFDEIKEAIALQPNNKVKLLYGVRTTNEGKQYQTISTNSKYILPYYSKDFTYAEKNLAKDKAAGFMSTVDYRIQPLAEYTVEPTNLNEAPAGNDAFGSEDATPWD